MYDNFIKLNWKGKAITTADNKIVKLEKEYEELGKEDLEITEIYNHIKSNLNLTKLISYPFTENKEINYLNIDNIIEEVIKNYDNNKDNIRNTIIEKINNIFEENNNLKLERFTLFHKYIIIEYKTIIDKFKYELYDYDDNKEEPEPNNDIYLLEKKCEFNFYRYILRNLELFEITDKELLIENNEWKLKRTSLKDEITKYNNCKTIIANL